MPGDVRGQRRERERRERGRGRRRERGRERGERRERNEEMKRKGDFMLGGLFKDFSPAAARSKMFEAVHKNDKI